MDKLRKEQDLKDIITQIHTLRSLFTLEVFDVLIALKSFRYLLLVFNACFNEQRTEALVKLSKDKTFLKGLDYLVEVVKAVELEECLK